MAAFLEPPAETFEVLFSIDDGAASFDRLIVRRQIEFSRVARYAANFQASLDTVDYEIDAMFNASQVFKTARRPAKIVVCQMTGDIIHIAIFKRDAIVE
jgi:hypothetical protein